MSHWLIVYSKPSGYLLRCQEFTDGQAALAERFAVERLHRNNPVLEIVVLGAESLDALKRTHGRYFKTVQELAADALEVVSGE